MLSHAWRRTIAVSMLGLLTGTLLSGCVTDGSEPIATVSYAQGDAYILRANSNAPTAAIKDEPLYAGDGFRTGAGTMQLVPASGGTVDVYPGTDPIIEKSFCFAVRLFSHGGLHVNGHGICVNETLTASDVGYEFVRPGVMRVWVLEGQVRLLLPPFATITSGQRADVEKGRIIGRSAFTPREFARRFPPVTRSVQPIGRLQRIRTPPPPPLPQEPVVVR